MIYVHWRPSDARKTTNWPEDTKLELHRPLEVHKNMDLDIDVGDGSVSGIGGGSVGGVVHQVFRSTEGLSLTAMRQVTSPEDKATQEEWRRAAVPVATVGTDGQFIVTQLPAGQYYLVLNNSEKTLGISDIFKIAESDHLNGIFFHHGNGQLLIRVVDARTGHQIPDALFSITNHLQANFFDKRHVRDKTERNMTTDDDGQRLYDGLPNGRYRVKADGYGYFFGQSTWADVTEDQQTELIVRLEPAALVSFDLTDAVREQITTDKVIVSCKVTKTTTQTVVEHRSLWGESDHHNILMSLFEPEDNIYSVLHLPEGTFTIDYTVQTIVLVDRAQVGPSKKVAQGKATVTCQLGQTSTIVVAGQ